MDEITSVQLSGGVLTLVINAAYLGDIQIWTFTFSVDLLILRPTLLVPPPRPSEDVVRDTTREFEPHVRLAQKKRRR